MGVYQKICYVVEDMFVKIIAKNQNNDDVQEKVRVYRERVEEYKSRKKKEQLERIQEKKRVAEQKREEEKKRVLKTLAHVVDIEQLDYTTYEYNEVKRNASFFNSICNQYFEGDEKGVTFLQCEFDKSSKQEIKGYLIVTNKRVLFISLNGMLIQKFRYQTIKHVIPSKDGILEKGISIQYGVKRLEFDEIFDSEQMKRVMTIINKSAQVA
ncbi:PH domain-containing protein [Cytobacillus sp. Hz8]|uniref:PH domain-containing protein n=1 Tax=Cytobacillus sp. Hz8 TaxID=3347168 RepID=UPI0035D5FCCE